MMTKTVKNRNIILLFGLFSLFLFFLNTVLYTSVPIPTVLNDEFGYWSISALLNGHDWTGLTEYCQYYSYGYGIFAAIIMKICKDPMLTYRAALYFNVILMCLSMLFGYKILCRMRFRLKRELLMAVSFAGTLYVSYVVNMQIGWVECLLTFFFVLISYLVLEVIRKPSTVKVFLLAIMNIGIYAVHQRTIGMLCATGMIMAVLVFMRKIKIGHFLVFIGCFLAAFGLHSLLKGYFQNNLWISQDVVIQSGNDYSGQVGKLGTLFSKEGILFFVLGVIGRTAYTGFASLGTLYTGFYDFGKESVMFLIDIFRKREKEDLSIYKFFMTLALLATIAIAIIFILIPGRIDNLVYGRYFEFALYPFLIYSLAFILDRGIQKKTAMIQVSVVLISLLITYAVEETMQLMGFVGTSSSALISLYWQNRSYAFLLIAGLLVLALMTLLVVIFNKRGRMRYWGLLVITGFWMVQGASASGIEFEANTEKKESAVNAASVIRTNSPDRIEYIDENDFETQTLVNNIQFLMPDRKIQMLPYDKMANDDNKVLLLKINTKYLQELSEEYDIIYGDSKILVMERRQRLLQ